MQCEESIEFTNNSHERCKNMRGGEGMLSLNNHKHVTGNCREESPANRRYNGPLFFAIIELSNDTLHTSITAEQRGPLYSKEVDRYLSQNSSSGTMVACGMVTRTRVAQQRMNLGI